MINSIFFISFYNKRPAHNLLNLINQLKYFNVQIAIVVNDDNSENIYFEKKTKYFLFKTAKYWDEYWSVGCRI